MGWIANLYNTWGIEAFLNQKMPHFGFLASFASFQAFHHELLEESFSFVCGRIRFSATPIRAERPMPVMLMLPTWSTAPPMPVVRINDTMMRLRVLPMSVLL